MEVRKPAGQIRARQLCELRFEKFSEHRVGRNRDGKLVFGISAAAHFCSGTSKG
jgi:hypothetical protein